MAFGLNIAALPAYTDQLSEQLISTAVLNTNLMEYVDLKAGYTSGSVSLNLVDADLPVSSFQCNMTPDGEVTYTQTTVTIEDLQSKTSMCSNDLRSVYQSAYMSPSMANDSIPFEEVLSQQYVEKLTKYNEGFLINGLGTTLGIKGQITGANGATVPAAAAAWTVSNAVSQALDLYDAIDESVINRDDIAIVCSPAAYRTLVRALVAQNLYHFPSVDGNEILILPGTNARIIMSSGLVGSNYAFAGPMKMITVLTGLIDEMDSFQFFYAPSEDQLLFRAAWRLGVGVAQINLFATNDLA